MEVDQQKPRVLLVEDEEALRSALRLNFELEGYEVTAVSTGRMDWRNCAVRDSMRW
jgi:DNA-binding response OmpR family regulator